MPAVRCTGPRSSRAAWTRFQGSARRTGRISSYSSSFLAAVGHSLVHLSRLPAKHIALARHTLLVSVLEFLPAPVRAAISEAQWEALVHERLSEYETRYSTESRLQHTRFHAFAVARIGLPDHDARAMLLLAGAHTANLQACVKIVDGCLLVD